MPLLHNKPWDGVLPACQIRFTQPCNEDERWILKIMTKVVGRQYHGGTLSGKDILSYQREPTNAYDCNAIQVLSPGGAHVGYVPREVASVLAPFLDREPQLRVIGYVKGGGKGKSWSQMLIAILSMPSARLMSSAHDVAARLYDKYCEAAKERARTFVPVGLGEPVYTLDPPLWRALGGSRINKEAEDSAEMERRVMDLESELEASRHAFRSHDAYVMQLQQRLEMFEKMHQDQRFFASIMDAEEFRPCMVVAGDEANADHRFFTSVMDVQEFRPAMTA
jgi:hypothetical protein